MMKVLLLPGMDGTGELFQPLLEYLSVDTTVIRLPQSGAQDYNTLTANVLRQLPNEEYVLLAESFSGPIAARIACSKPDYLKGVIFVATFLKPPVHYLLYLAAVLPLVSLVRLPFATVGIRWFLLGRSASDEVVKCFRDVVTRLPEQLLKNRLKSIKGLERVECKSECMTLYIQAKGDRLVDESMWSDFSAIFSDSHRKVINGPHLLLQTRPRESADEIMGFLERCN